MRIFVVLGLLILLVLIYIVIFYVQETRENYTNSELIEIGNSLSELKDFTDNATNEELINVLDYSTSS